MARIDAGNSMKLVRQATADTQVNWVACRADGDAISRLIDNGTRGGALFSQRSAIARHSRGA